MPQNSAMPHSETTLNVKIKHRFAGFDLDLAFEAPNGVTALFGRSGAGKTTVINAVAGLLKPDEGRITINGNIILDTGRSLYQPTHKRNIGYVFQEARLFPHLTVRQNLTFSKRFQRLQTTRSNTKPDAHKSALNEDDLIELLGLTVLLDRRPAALSGGERQRVAIGRALFKKPSLLLLDEPLAALDMQRKAELLPYLERLRDDLEIPMLYVSHAVSEVARLATTIIAINKGRITRQGPAAQMLADPDAFPQLGREEAGAFLKAKLLSHDEADGLSTLAFSGGTLLAPRIEAALGAELRVRIRARDIILARKAPEETSALNILPAIVQRIGNQQGPIVDVSIRCGEDDILARITRRSLNALELAPGTPCFALLKSITLTRKDIGIHEPRP